MERRVTVNDRIEPVELGTPEDRNPSEGQDGLGGEGERTAVGAHGPCLFLGGRGERCALPAVAGGYCAKHHTDPELRLPERNYTRVLVATVALIVILWPYIAELARDLIRWLSSPQ